MTGNRDTVRVAIDQERAPDLDLRRLGLLFAHAESEQRYQEWSRNRRVPLIRVGMVASAAGYAVYLLTVFVLEHSSFAEIWPMVAAFLAILLAIFVATWSQGLRPLLVPALVVANCLSGLLLAWQIHELINTPDRFELAATAVLIPVMFGYCVYQLGPVAATLATVPFIALSQYFLYRDFVGGDISLATAGSMAAMQLIACNTGVFVSWVIERGNRRTFRKDQIIDVQRAQLRESRDAIRRYVPPAVADLIIRGETSRIDQPVRRLVTILFADMVGFTEVSERISPEDLTHLLMDYLSGMSDKVEQHGGTLNEFTGDGLMAMFGAPDPMEPEEQARRAIDAARDMQALMSVLNERWERIGIGRPLQIRIGINTGSASVGSYGSKGRMTYTAMGLHTNITSRLEKAAEPGGVLLSESTYQLAAEHVPCEARGDVSCKGVHEPVRVYALRV